MLSLKGLLAVFITAAILAIPLYYYWGFLTRGMAPSAEIQRLNQMEKEGVPDFVLPDLKGHSVSLNQYKDKPVLINLWASWCGPCVKEFPSLIRLMKHFDKKFVILAVSHDHSRDDLESFIRTFGSVPDDFIILWDRDRTTSTLLGTDQLPETYILDREHHIVRKIVGEQLWDQPAAIEFFAHVLGI